jgi:uroporphyrinogen-III synthase
LRLLVTRPEEDAAETAAELAALGHEVIVQPLFAIAFMPPPVPVTKPGALAFTSRNGVRAFLRWPEATGWRDLPAFAVGDATAAFLRAEHFTDIRTAAGDTEALAGLIAADFPPASGAIVYPAPREGAYDLASVLGAKGFAVRRFEAYGTIAATRLDDAVQTALRDRRLDGALFFSRRTAAIFGELVRKAELVGAVAGMTMFALSEAVAGPLRELGAGRVAVAAHADRASLFALLPTASQPSHSHV